MEEALVECLRYLLIALCDFAFSDKPLARYLGLYESVPADFSRPELHDFRCHHSLRTCDTTRASAFKVQLVQSTAVKVVVEVSPLIYCEESVHVRV